jgi:hypothetical protein
MPFDDIAPRGRHLSDDDVNEDEPLDLDVDESVYEDDEGGEMVEDEDEETESDLPPTVHISDTLSEDDAASEKEGFGVEKEETTFE